MANWISLFRIALSLFILAWLLAPGSGASEVVYWWAFILTIVVIWLDGLDGYVARLLNESSKLGAVVDIMCDRAVELVFWVGFLALGWVPVWVPLVFIVRGVVVDGLRSVALEQGFTAFGSSTMMQSGWGVALVSSRASRWLYAVAKAVVFALLVLAHHPSLQGAEWIHDLNSATMGLVWFVTGFCLVRGLPVILESPRLFQQAVSSPESSVKSQEQ